ncbi:hypothetical protein F5X96DRAFT_130848 [Biscogniauxia mediterranea]|nr:hypothetical protein F5X96DRAFT_130848 [Biscogniauxia mediterranea]
MKWLLFPFSLFFFTFFSFLFWRLLCILKNTYLPIYTTSRGVDDGRRGVGGGLVEEGCALCCVPERLVRKGPSLGPSKYSADPYTNDIPTRHSVGESLTNINLPKF